MESSLAPLLAGAPGDWETSAGRVTYVSRDQVLAFAVAVSQHVPGNIVEFGTYKGGSTRAIRDELERNGNGKRGARQKLIYTCDSFQGLSEDYENMRKGAFATKVPDLPGVRIVEGFFADSLTEQLAKEVGRVSFAHLDADLYSSTLTALTWLTPLLRSGSVLAFDEFIGDDPSEARALLDWQRDSGVQLALVAMFGREPSGNGERTDRRALFQVVGSDKITKAPPLFRVRLRRRLGTWYQARV